MSKPEVWIYQQKKILTAFEFLSQISKWHPDAHANVLGTYLIPSTIKSTSKLSQHSRINWDSFTSLYLQGHPSLSIIVHQTYFHQPTFYQLCICQSDEVTLLSIIISGIKSKLFTITYTTA